MRGRTEQELKVPTTVTEVAARRSTVEAALPVLPPLAAVVEIAVLFAALTLGDWLHPGIELADIRPHPFWIPVLLLSVQYGTVSGLIAAGVAIALTVSGGFPEQGTSETYFTYLLKIWIEPILWIGAAVLVGQFRMRQIAHKRELLGKVEELTSQRAAIADYARNLRSHCTALERQIAGRNDGDPLRVLQALQQARDATAGATDDALSQALAHLVGAAMPGARASLYGADSTGLRIAAASHDEPGTHARPWIGSSDALYRSIVLEGVGASVLTRDGEARLGGTGIAAVPVYAQSATGVGPTRHVIGMLKIDDMPASALTSTCLPALSAMGLAFAPALDARSSGRPVPVMVVAAPVPLTSSQKIWRHLRWLRGREPSATETTTDVPQRHASSVKR